MEVDQEVVNEEAPKQEANTDQMQEEDSEDVCGNGKLCFILVQLLTNIPQGSGDHSGTRGSGSDVVTASSRVCFPMNIVLQDVIQNADCQIIKDNLKQVQRLEEKNLVVVVL